MATITTTTAMTAADMNTLPHDVASVTSTTPHYDSLRTLTDPKTFSPVRRAFCLLAGFDIILITLLWIIFLNVLSGAKFEKEFDKEVVNYNITTSLFDTVVIAFLRMVFLETAYAIFRIQHWWMISFTTTGSTAFMITKCVVYNFDVIASGRPVDYFLFLASLIIPWIETWFIVLKVFPFEKKTRDIWEANIHNTDRRPLLAPLPGLQHPYPSMYYTGFSAGGTSFYSPTSSFKGDDDDEEDDLTNVLSTEEQHLLEEGRVCTDRLLELLSDSRDEWVVEGCAEHGATVYSTNKYSQYGTVYLLEAVFDINADVMCNYLRDNFDNAPMWNKQLIESRIVKSLSHTTRIQYHVSSPTGPVASRDFVSICRQEKRGKTHINATKSCLYTAIPVTDRYVRGENVCNGFIANPQSDGNQCEMRWVFCNDLKLWIPNQVLERAMKGVLLKFHSSLLALVDILNTQQQQQQQQPSN